MPYSKKEKRKANKEMDRAIKKTNLKVGRVKLKGKKKENQKEEAEENQKKREG